MLRFFVLTVLFASALGSAIPLDPYGLSEDQEVNERIVGGEEAVMEDAPWQTAMLRLWGVQYYLACGGSILSATVILSAATCTEESKPFMWRVRAGSEQFYAGGQNFEITDFVVHENYTNELGKQPDYDLSLFFLVSPLVLDYIRTAPIALPVQNQTIAQGTVGLITGWGAVINGNGRELNLRKAMIPVVNISLCEEAFGSNYTERMICLGDYEEGGVDACRGDEGGPFVVNFELIGVASWGEGCARPGSPGVFTLVSYFREWIDRNVPEL